LFVDFKLFVLIVNSFFLLFQFAKIRLFSHVARFARFFLIF